MGRLPLLAAAAAAVVVAAGLSLRCGAAQRASLVTGGTVRACWQRVLQDWLDPPIEDAYSASCYRAALHRVDDHYSGGAFWTLPSDLSRQLGRARHGVVPPER